MAMNRFFSKRYSVLFCLLIIAIISRLPLVIDPMIPDGDEALLGLMSIFQLEKGEIPWFFWGQRYGFSLIEVSSISLFQGILGYTDLSIKLGILTLWLITLSGLFLFFKELINIRWAFALVLLFALHPAWYYWSLKARGGYMSALMASSWLFYLMTLKKGNPWLIAALAGALMALVYHSMKLWVPSTLFLVIGILLRGKHKLQFRWATAIGSMAVVYWLIYRQSLQYPDYWRPEVSDFSLWKENLLLAPGRIRDFFLGNYFLGDIHPTKELTQLAWLVTKCLFFITIPIAVIQWQDRNDKASQVFILMAALLPFGPLFITNEFFSPRYLLPAPFFILVWIATQWTSFRYEKPLGIIACFLGILFFGGAWQLTQTDYYRSEAEERKAKMLVAQKLLNDGYQYVLCNSPETHWQLMYYSGGNIICSGIYHHDRLAYFPQEVRRAYIRGDQVIVLARRDIDYPALKSYFEPYGIYHLLRKPEPWQLDSLGIEMRLK
jgi:hypothetical protein